MNVLSQTSGRTDKNLSFRCPYMSVQHCCTVCYHFCTPTVTCGLIFFLMMTKPSSHNWSTLTITIDLKKKKKQFCKSNFMPSVSTPAELQGAHSRHRGFWDHVWAQGSEKEAQSHGGGCEGPHRTGWGIFPELWCRQGQRPGGGGHWGSVRLLEDYNQWIPLALLVIGAAEFSYLNIEKHLFSFYNREEVREEIFKKGQSKRIWGELYKVSFVSSQ